MKVWFKQTLHLHLADLLREWYQLLWYEKKMYIINEINSLVFLANFFLSNLTLFFFLAYSLKTLILFYHLTKNQFVFNISVIYVVFFRRGGCFWCFIFPFLFLCIQRSIIFLQMFCYEKRMVCGLLRQLFSCLLVIWIADWSLPIKEEILFLKTKCSIKFKVQIGKMFIPWCCIAQENWCVHS